MSDKAGSFSLVIVFAILVSAGGLGLAYKVWLTKSPEERLQAVIFEQRLTSAQKAALIPLLSMTGDDSSQREQLRTYFQRLADKIAQDSQSETNKLRATYQRS